MDSPFCVDAIATTAPRPPVTMLSRIHVVCVVLAFVLAGTGLPATQAGSFDCTKHSDKPGYRCTRFEVTNHMPTGLAVVSSHLPHGEWEESPSAIPSGTTGAWEANSDCPLLDCFFGASPSVVLNVGGTDVTFYGENNLDKLLYGCNKETVGPIPAPVEIAMEGENFSGCYCCHTAPCDCSSFENANHYAVSLAVAPLPAITSISPAFGPSKGVPVTVTGSGFVDTDGLACKFGSVVVSAAYLSPTSIICSAPTYLAPGTADVPLSVSNLQSKWSTPTTFSYVSTNPGLKLFFGNDMMNTVKAALLPVLEKALTNEKVSYFAGSDTVIGITIDYNLTNIVLNSVDFGDVTIATSDSGITLSTSGLTVVTSMDWYYKDVHTIIHGSGSAVDTVSLDLSASFSVVREGPPSGGDGLPHLSNVDVSATITSLDIKTKPWSAEILIALLKGPLKSGFQSMLKEKLSGALTTTLNAAFANMTMKVPAGDDMVIDFSFLFSPTFSTDGVEFYLRAAALPTNPEQTMPLVAPAIAEPSTVTQSVRALASNYLGNSAMYVMFENKKLSGVVTQKMLPPMVPLTLNTTFFKNFLPALYKAFPNRKFDLMINATEAPVIELMPMLPKSVGPGMTVNTTLNITFLITCPATTAGDVRTYLRARPSVEASASCKAQPAFTLSVGVYTDLGFKFHDGALMNGTHMPAVNITGDMYDLEFTVALASTNIGQFPLTNLKMLLSMMLRAVALDMVNTKLEKGFLIPATLGALAINDAALSFDDNYAAISANVVLSALGLAPAPAAAGDADEPSLRLPYVPLMGDLARLE